MLSVSQCIPREGTGGAGRVAAQRSRGIGAVAVPRGMCVTLTGLGLPVPFEEHSVAELLTGNSRVF